jgi:hypothetical protein
MDMNHARILRAAEHWARGVSKEFDAHVTDCMGSLALRQATGGALVLQGATSAGEAVSICLTGPEIHLLRVTQIKADGYAAIRRTEVELPLPAYLRRQLAQRNGVAA